MYPTFTPRQVAGMIRRVGRLATVYVAVPTGDRFDRSWCRVSRAAALQMVRSLYRTGRRLEVTDFAGDLVIGA